jgi:hypothetical protein
MSTSALRRALIAIVYKRRSPDVGLTIQVSSISKSATLSPRDTIAPGNYAAVFVA